MAKDWRNLRPAPSVPSASERFASRASGLCSTARQRTRFESPWRYCGSPLHYGDAGRRFLKH
jgi:hypothetical protein